MAGKLKTRSHGGHPTHFLDGKIVDPEGTTLDLRLSDGSWVQGCYIWPDKRSNVPRLLLHLASPEKGMLAELKLPSSAVLRWPKN